MKHFASGQLNEPVPDVCRPVAFFVNGIGDAFLTLPALRALSELFRGRLTLICTRLIYQLYAWELRVNRHVEVRVWDREDGRYIDVDNIVRQIDNCDIFISLVPWHSKSLEHLIKQLRPRISVGFRPGFDVVLAVGRGVHAADKAFAAPRYFDNSLRIEKYARAPAFPASTGSIVAHAFSELPASAQVVALHPDTKKEKMWPVNRWEALLDDFLGDHPSCIVIVVGRLRDRLCSVRHSDRVIGAGGVGLVPSFALVSYADIFIGVDSCMLHVADLCRVPGVGLFGPTSSIEAGFRFAAHRHVSSNGTMESITVSAALEALEALSTEVGWRGRFRG